MRFSKNISCFVSGLFLLGFSTASMAADEECFDFVNHSTNQTLGFTVGNDRDNPRFVEAGATYEYCESNAYARSTTTDEEGNVIIKDGVRMSVVIPEQDGTTGDFKKNVLHIPAKFYYTGAASESEDNIELRQHMESNAFVDGNGAIFEYAVSANKIEFWGTSVLLEQMLGDDNYPFTAYLPHNGADIESGYDAIFTCSGISDCDQGYYITYSQQTGMHYYYDESTETLYSSTNFGVFTNPSSTDRDHMTCLVHENAIIIVVEVNNYGNVNCAVH